MRKSILSPAQNEILMLLEEAGEEDVRTLKASVSIADEELARAIAELQSLGFIRPVSHGGWPALVLTEEGRATLTK